MNAAIRAWRERFPDEEIETWFHPVTDAIVIEVSDGERCHATKVSLNTIVDADDPDDLLRDAAEMARRDWDSE